MCLHIRQNVHVSPVCKGRLLSVIATAKSIYDCWIMRTERSDYLCCSPGYQSTCISISRGTLYSWWTGSVHFVADLLSCGFEGSSQLRESQETHLFLQAMTLIYHLLKKGLQPEALSEMWKHPACSFHDSHLNKLIWLQTDHIQLKIESMMRHICLLIYMTHHVHVAKSRSFLFFLISAVMVPTNLNISI